MCAGIKANFQLKALTMPSPPMRVAPPSGIFGKGRPFLLGCHILFGKNALVHATLIFKLSKSIYSKIYNVQNIEKL
jgi:hypothetical protein